LSIARRLRSQGRVPIIILSARGEDVDRIVGLEVGADDYLPKPFNPRELLARIRAVLRRPAEQTAAAPDALHRFGLFTLDVTRHVLLRAGAEITLTAGEFALLRVLVEHPNRVLTRDQLIEHLKAMSVRRSIARSTCVSRACGARSKTTGRTALPAHRLGRGLSVHAEGQAST